MRNKKVRSKIVSRRDNQWVGALYISPFIFGFLFFFFRQIISTVRYSFSEIYAAENGLDFKFVGWNNFYHALRVDPSYFKHLLQTLQSILTIVPMVLIFSLFIAVLLNGNVKGRAFFRAVFFLPVIVTTGLISRLDMNNQVIQVLTTAASSAESGEVSALGDASAFLQQMEFSPGLVSIVSGISSQIVSIVNLSGVQILISLAAIQSISPSVYEAADIEGATAWEKFWKITIPMVMPVMLVNLLYSLIDFLTRDNTSLMQYIQNTAFIKGNFGEASAMSWIYCLSVLLMLSLGFLVFKLIRRFYNRED